MEWLVVLALVGAAGGGAWLFRHRQPARGKAANVRQLTLESLGPGDVVSLEMGQFRVVDAVLRCAEEVGSRTTTWQWNFLSDNCLLEVAPDAIVLYERAEVLHQGEAGFESLAGEGGALKGFEERVRAGTVGSNPVYFDHQQKRYLVCSTGTFRPTSTEGPLPGEVWRDVALTPGDNVYFEMEGPNKEQVLGIWTTHIALLFGRSLTSAEVLGLYPKPEGP